MTQILIGLRTSTRRDEMGLEIGRSCVYWQQSNPTVLLLVYQTSEIFTFIQDTHPNPELSSVLCVYAVTPLFQYLQVPGQCLQQIHNFPIILMHTTISLFQKIRVNYKFLPLLSFSIYLVDTQSVEYTYLH